MTLGSAGSSSTPWPIPSWAQGPTCRYEQWVPFSSFLSGGCLSLWSQSLVMGLRGEMRSEVLWFLPEEIAV